MIGGRMRIVNYNIDAERRKDWIIAVKLSQIDQVAAMTSCLGLVEVLISFDLWEYVEYHSVQF